MKRSKTPLLATVAALMTMAFLSACSPDVGSKGWCEDMKEKPKGDWTTNEATEFAKNCVL